MSTTSLQCPACGRSDWRADLDAGEYALVRCGCGLRALDRDPDAADALMDNESMYGGEEYNAWYRSMEDVLKARYADDLNEIEARIKPGSILDIGCSYGWFLQVAQSRGWTVTGVEATDVTAKVARDGGIDVRTGTLEEIGFADASFDVVCLWDVLEHVPQIDGFLAEIRRVLKPGGILALQSPNIASVMARQAGRGWSWLLLPHHVWHFTPATMRSTLEQRGFQVQRVYTWEPPEAFINDLQLYKQHPSLGSKAVRQVTDKVLVLAEKAWCKAGRGGLIKAFARRVP